MILCWHRLQPRLQPDPVCADCQCVSDALNPHSMCQLQMWAKATQPATAAAGQVTQDLAHDFISHVMAREVTKVFFGCMTFSQWCIRQRDVLLCPHASCSSLCMTQALPDLLHSSTMPYSSCRGRQ